MTKRKLSAQEERVIVHKGTEPPFTGEFVDHHADGTYRCKRCGAALYASTTKFDSGCGWPSFDDALAGAVREIPDPDGLRTEIVCAACGGHLGHVFRGEGFTAKDTRHCVNSISIDFAPATGAVASAEPGTGHAPAVGDAAGGRAIFAGGCFWGVEHLMAQVEGVLSVTSGYVGGRVATPSYEKVCSGTTGHAEAVEVRFDPARTSFQTLARRFFEIHDPTQKNRQGPDVGTQYRSAVFYLDDTQRRIAEELIATLRDKGYDVVTEVVAAGEFWPAEPYHQDYYQRKGTEPYCHVLTPRF